MHYSFTAPISLAFNGAQKVAHRLGIDTGTISGDGISCFAYQVLLCLVMWEFTEPRKIRAKFTLGLHSQANREDARLDPCDRLMGAAE